jgi:hypothetical protein
MCMVLGSLRPFAARGFHGKETAETEEKNLRLRLRDLS